MVGRAYMPVSKTTEYETPHDLFDQLDKEFGPFTLDPCGQREHYSVCRVMGNRGHFYDGSTEAMDGLLQPWKAERVFLNPPYGREMPRWIERGVAQLECGNITGLLLALIPARTDTKMWQKYVLSEITELQDWTPSRELHPRLCAVRFLPGRLKFGGMKNAAPFPSAVVVWRAPDAR